MKLVVVSKILQEVLHASWNFRSAHKLHHPMKVKKSNFNSYLTVLSWLCLISGGHYRAWVGETCDQETENREEETVSVYNTVKIWKIAIKILKFWTPENL